MIDAEDMARLKEIFVTRQECDTITSNLEKEMLEYKTDVAVIKQRLDTITWLDKLILGTVITGIIAAILAMVF